MSERDFGDFSRWLICKINSKWIVQRPIGTARYALTSPTWQTHSPTP